MEDDFFIIFLFFGVIGLEKRLSALEHQKQLIFEQGVTQGKFEVALKIKDVDGIEKAIAMSGFSREELERGKLTPESH